MILKCCYFDTFHLKLVDNFKFLMNVYVLTKVHEGYTREKEVVYLRFRNWAET